MRHSGTALAPPPSGFVLAPQDSEVDFGLAQEILRYFSRNPQAADTVEGVARWRLLDERIHSNLERVRRAIALLVSRGLLVQESTSPSTAVFRLNKEERREIEHFLHPATPRKRKKTGTN